MAACLRINGILEQMTKSIHYWRLEKIDGYLKVLNDDYRVERIAAVTDVFLEILPPNAFSNWMKIT